jgi:hypothetical protein
MGWVIWQTYWPEPMLHSEGVQGCVQVGGRKPYEGDPETVVESTKREKAKRPGITSDSGESATKFRAPGVGLGS